MRTRALSLAAATATVLVLTTAHQAAYANDNTTSTAFLRPGHILAPPEITDIKPEIADIAAATELAGGERAQTRDTVTVTLGSSVLFAKDSAALSQAARDRLDKVAGDIRAQHATHITVNGYTDNLGSAAHGLALSRRRAQAVQHALAASLPETVRYTVHGYGEQRPIAPNTSGAGRAANRRTVITFRAAFDSRRTGATRSSARRGHRPTRIHIEPISARRGSSP